MKSFLIAMATYTKIPIPGLKNVQEKDYKYVFCFFPFVGVIIGCLEALWFHLYYSYHFPASSYSIVAVVIPFLVTGGFHLDGFMDTVDAMCSYKDRESKLAILKDSHVGAFSVIAIVMYFELYVAAVRMIIIPEYIAIFSLGFVLSRVITAIAVLYFPMIDENGSLAKIVNSTRRVFSLVVLHIEMITVITIMLVINVAASTGIFIIAVFTLAYCYLKFKKNFGGLSGDMAGYILTLSELMYVIVIAIVQIIMINIE